MMNTSFTCKVLLSLALSWAWLGVADAAKFKADRVYKSKCKTCHGAKGEGNEQHAIKGLKIDPKLLELTAMGKKTDEELLKIIATGAGKMPGYEKKYSPEEMKALLDYCFTLVPREKSK